MLSFCASVQLEQARTLASSLRLAAEEQDAKIVRLQLELEKARQGLGSKPAAMSEPMAAPVKRELMISVFRFQNH
jgi:hypothetical protein